MRVFNDAESQWSQQKSSAKENQPYDISYSITPFYDFNVIRLTVVFEFKGDKSGNTRIILPNNFGSNYDLKGLKYLKPLSINTTIEETDNLEIKTVKYPSNTTVQISYQVEQVRSGNATLGNQYMSTIANRYFNFFGETFFVVLDCNWSTEFNFKIEWTNIPAKWNLANSFGINEKVQYVRLPLWKLRCTVFTGGDF